MNKDDKALLDTLTRQIAGMLAGAKPEDLPSETCSDPVVEDLCRQLRLLVKALTEAKTFIAALSEGNLEMDPPARNHLISPFKQLHANLRHLAWQTKQIAAGDLSQQVDFLGEFSVSFNAMIASLREKELAEERLRYVSNHDALTQLYNRYFFNEELVRLERSRQFPVSILVGDLDGLKTINDTLGHSAGDRLIQLAAQALQQAVRADDILARIGGDEFAVLLPLTDEATAGSVVNRIYEIFEESNRSGNEFHLRISIGAATAVQKVPLSDLLVLADKRMYENKAVKKQSGEYKGAYNAV